MLGSERTSLGSVRTAAELAAAGGGAVGTMSDIWERATFAVGQSMIGSLAVAVMPVVTYLRALPAAGQGDYNTPLLGGSGIVQATTEPGGGIDAFMNGGAGRVQIYPANGTPGGAGPNCTGSLRAPYFFAARARLSSTTYTSSTKAYAICALQSTDLTDQGLQFGVAGDVDTGHLTLRVVASHGANEAHQVLDQVPQKGVLLTYAILSNGVWSMALVGDPLLGTLTPCTVNGVPFKFYPFSNLIWSSVYAGVMPCHDFADASGGRYTMSRLQGWVGELR